MRLPPRRIHLADTDATGVAYAGRLVDLVLQRLEEALAAVGLEAAQLVSRPAGPAVVHIGCRFLRPARLGQRLSAIVTLAEQGVSSARFSVRLGLAVEAEVVLAWVDHGAGRSAPWPSPIKRRLARLGR